MTGIMNMFVGAVPSGVTSYRYVRWYITAVRTAGNYAQASEFVLYSGGSPITMSGSTVTNPGGSNPASETPAKLVDGSTSTKWLDFNIPSNGYTNLIFDFGAGNEVTFDQYYYYTANDTSGRDPVSWTISGSNDGTNWDLLGTETNVSVTTTRYAAVGPFSVTI